MSKTETYYLIDFENVNESGLSNIENLTAHDHIHIFSTENAPKISFHTLAAFNKIDFNSHIVPTGNQSLDMHLIAYLGYLIGKNPSNNCKYVIISKDTDYDHSIAFLKKIANVKICRQTSLCLISKPQNSAPKKKTASAQLNSKTELNTKIQRAISNAGYDHSTSNTVASIVSKHFGSTRILVDVHNTLRNTYKDYTDLYQIIKPILQSSGSQVSVPTNAKLNNTVQKILSNAAYDNKTISYVASLVCKKHGCANAKQTIYTTLIEKYGAGPETVSSFV